MKQIEKVNNGFFKSKALEIINENDIQTAISEAGNELINRISEWISEWSGWVIKSDDKYEIDISKYKPLKGSSYLPLPDKIKNKKATINKENKNIGVQKISTSSWVVKILFPDVSMARYHSSKVLRSNINY